MPKNIFVNILIGAFIIIGSLLVVAFKPVNLGLDLKGGISMVLAPDVDKVIKEEYENTASDISKLFLKNHINVLDVTPSQEGIYIDLLNASDYSKVYELLKKYYTNRIDVSKVSSLKVKVTFSSIYLSQIKENVITQTVEVLRRRVDQLGVVQPVITKLGNSKVMVELPGVMDLERAKKVLGKTAQLELMEVVDASPSLDALQKELKPDEKILPSKDGHEWYLVKKKPIITGADLKTAYESTDSFNNPAVSFELNSKGAEIFGNFTQSHIGKRLAIVLDNRVMSAPVIRSRISDQGQITGNFTPDQVRDLAAILRAGALPTTLHILQDAVVGPTLGKAAIKQSIYAGLASFLFVVFLIIARYKTAGVTATIAIIMNGLLLWAGLVLLGATLTLPGIAGIILNMGIAVDSNVLIFERIKEEIARGNTLRKAIEYGYKRVLSAVYDTHATLLVAALILFQFSSGPVKGFATTLTIGTIASFLSNVYYSKAMIDILAKLRMLKI